MLRQMVKKNFTHLIPKRLGGKKGWGGEHLSYDLFYFIFEYPFWNLKSQLEQTLQCCSQGSSC